MIFSVPARRPPRLPSTSALANHTTWKLNFHHFRRSSTTRDHTPTSRSAIPQIATSFSRQNWGQTRVRRNRSTSAIESGKRRRMSCVGRAAGMLCIIGALLAGTGCALRRAPASAPQIAAVDALFTQWNRSDSPGCVALVIKNGRTVHSRGYGMADLEHRVPLTAASVLNVGSLAKQFTATAAALLDREGRLSLDDDVRRHVPELPQYSRPITIRDLIHHTSGLRDYYFLLRLKEPRLQHVLGNDDVLSLLGRQEGLNSSPGDEFLYTNSGYVALSTVIERAAGQPMTSYVEQAIFRPLGMTSARFVDEAGLLIPHRAEGYRRTAAGSVLRSPVTHGRVGDAGLWMTIGDLAKWIANFELPKAGDGAFIERITTPATLRDGSPTGYAFGLVVDHALGEQRIRHSGETAGYRADLLMLPPRRLAVAVLCNVADARPSVAADRIAELFGVRRTTNASLALRTAETTNYGEVSDLPGVYFDRQREIVRRVELRDGKLFFGSTHGSARMLVPVGEQAFMIKDTNEETTVRFIRDGNDPALEITSISAPRSLFHRVPTADDHSKTEHAGSFWSAEIEERYEILLIDGQMHLRRTGRSDVVLEPAFLDAYHAPGVGLIRFSREADEVSGFLISTPRARRVRFSREDARNVCP